MASPSLWARHKSDAWTAAATSTTAGSRPASAATSMGSRGFHNVDTASPFHALLIQLRHEHERELSQLHKRVEELTCQLLDSTLRTSRARATVPDSWLEAEKCSLERWRNAAMGLPESAGPQQHVPVVLSPPRPIVPSAAAFPSSDRIDPIEADVVDACTISSHSSPAKSPRQRAPLLADGNLFKVPADYGPEACKGERSGMHPPSGGSNAAAVDLDLSEDLSMLHTRKKPSSRTSRTPEDQSMQKPRQRSSSRPHSARSASACEELNPPSARSRPTTPKPRVPSSRTLSDSAWQPCGDGVHGDADASVKKKAPVCGDLVATFETFAGCSEMRARTFVRCIKASGLVGEDFTTTDCDYLFAKVKTRGVHTIDFLEFYKALSEIAAKCGLSLAALETLVCDAKKSEQDRRKRRAEAAAARKRSPHPWHHASDARHDGNERGGSSSSSPEPPRTRSRPATPNRGERSVSRSRQRSASPIWR
eukprot:gnl/TRDRNA2_/TRDRNA2_92064_c0_seq2.p1 gnl/TRDRNA2_/TRDRNA2_92064_c0~~gnl/TRDRNA2_/TRDRNA2_92064_c0_seq2.p1  ORF type:complete len:479 (-),score=49.47 gnl/TRDRNA2_/TRDRNA2_92064_c0_seq2:101-1537(-)